MKKVGILNSGGDVQALNAVISSFTKTATSNGLEVIGFEKGWEGILDPVMYRRLERKDVRGLAHIGGTILGTTNKGRFAGKVGMGDKNKIPDEILDMAVKNLNELEIDALVAIGGDGGMSSALQLAKRGIKIIGVPKTIDNDLENTDKTFGFSTAVDIVVEALDRIHTTATSHERVILIEVMGRHTGWLALYGGFAGGADVILLPEVPFSYEELIDNMRNRKEHGYRSTVIVVAEGANAMDEEKVTQSGFNKSEAQLGGVSFEIMKRLESMSPGEFELRNTVLGHTQRGGIPNSEDRLLAKCFGVAATDAILNEDFGKMLSLKGDKIVTIPLEEAVEKLKEVSHDDLVFQSAKKMGIFLGRA